mmetsp:Transcript_6877/g.7340  ORF Transcript_6877/g.7340 Transcript_6877/m.7340 type:complete len:174 (-) Transcript_6877:738-1259(-)
MCPGRIIHPNRRGGSTESERGGDCSSFSATLPKLTPKKVVNNSAECEEMKKKMELVKEEKNDKWINIFGLLKATRGGSLEWSTTTTQSRATSVVPPTRCSFRYYSRKHMSVKCEDSTTMPTDLQFGDSDGYSCSDRDRLRSARSRSRDETRRRTTVGNVCKQQGCRRHYRTTQ